jgi:hypothetical protein
MSSQLGQENKVTIHKDSIFEKYTFNMPLLVNGFKSFTTPIIRPI